MMPVEKLPGWAQSQRFTIEAAAAGTPSPEAMLGPMLQALLQERFKLRVRTEFEELPVYLMTAVQGGPQLARSRAGSCRSLSSYEPLVSGQGPPALCGLPMTLGNQWRMNGATMEDFAAALSLGLDRPVLDQTGLSGTFDANIPLTGELAEMLRPGAPATKGVATPSMDLFDVKRALAQKMGLRLSPGKGKAPILVIERVERPSAN